MIGDMLSEIVGMFGSFVGPVLPFIAGFVGLVVFALVCVALWWARPQDETDPVPLIDRGASDWLGQP